MNVPNLIQEIVKNGIEVSLRMRDEDTIVFDVNTGAKSGLELSYDGDNKWTAYMRYNEVEKLEDPDITEICWLVKHCMHGRDYVHIRWVDLMVEHGVLQKIVETKVSYR